MQELKFEELSIKQKIGMVTCGLISGSNRSQESDEYVLDMIRNHSLGAIWVNPKTKGFDDIMARIKQAADYPILIMTDAESGLGDYMIGRQNTLGMTDREDMAYVFGKATAVTARKMGYNVVCNPILDMCSDAGICGANTRSMGSNKYRVAALGKAQARGMHDGGVLTVGKHYPSARKNPGRKIDSHMAERTAYETKEELVEHCLYPYLELMKEGLLDGVMTAHVRVVNVDNDYPASLSKKVNAIIREKGFDGFLVTDALSMMGVVAKFGRVDAKGLSVENGNDLALVWTPNTKDGYDAMCECYEKGILSEARINEASKKILEIQHRIFTMTPACDSLTEEEQALFKKIHTDSVFAKLDDGVPAAISREGKHLFIALAPNETSIKDDGKVDVDTFKGGWYSPVQIMNKVQEFFPNSEFLAIREYPTGWNICCALDKATQYDDVVLVTYQEAEAYVGRECLTARIVSMVDALQVTERVAAVVHFGNPYVLEDLVHIKRILCAPTSKGSIDAAFDVLCGNYPAKGKLTYDVHFE